MARPSNYPAEVRERGELVRQADILNAASAFFARELDLRDLRSRRLQQQPR